MEFLKVFISHKQADSSVAVNIQRAFKEHDVEVYLDVLDAAITGKGKALTDHIKEQLNKCSDIIVVMSENTKLSWWVPFEIGMSAQVDMPTATFLARNLNLPDYLSYWPRLKEISDIGKYVATRKSVSQQMRLQRDILFESLSESERRNIETPEFYRKLKLALS